MTQKSVPVEIELGYFYHPRERPNAPGHPRLDVLLRSVPSGKHFDPMRVRLSIVTKLGRIEFIKVRHPWPLLDHYRACAAGIILQDCKGNIVEAFTFGGDLRIETEDGLSTCVLTSPAPILELIETSSIPVILSEETEILLAERRAGWAHDPSIYDKRLSAADPLILYIACLEAIRKKFEHIPTEESELIREFGQFIHVEIKTLRELHEWPLYIPLIDELL